MHPSTTYHLYNHANGGDDLFREEENYRYFLRRCDKYINPIADTMAYCLMPNHFHFMVRTKVRELLIPELLKKNKLNLRGLSEDSSLEEIRSFILDLRGLSKNSNQEKSNSHIESRNKSLNLEGLDDIYSSYLIQQFSNLFNGYTKAINKRYRRYGSLFAPRFRRKAVETKSYLINLLSYIHANPVLHGFSMEYGEWPYTSYDQLLMEESWKTHFFGNFEDTPDYINHHLTYLKEKLHDGHDSQFENL